MEIGQNLPARDAPRRDRLPNRRPAETIAFERDGSLYEMTIGYYPDGRAGEVFLNADRADSLLDVLTSDAAILASLALQYGCPLEAITHAVKRDARGMAASPIGAALDLIT
jgi:ribonucleoside-diphosphate reductase alpha chain